MRKFLMVAAVLAVAACGEKEAEGGEAMENEMAPATTEMAPAANEMAPADTGAMKADSTTMAADDTSHAT